MCKHYGWQIYIYTDANLYHLFQYYERFRKKTKETMEQKKIKTILISLDFPYAFGTFLTFYGEPSLGVA